MKAWLVLEDDSKRMLTSVVAAFDSKEKAQKYVASEYANPVWSEDDQAYLAAGYHTDYMVVIDEIEIR